jgi:hypothetical protein
MRSAPSRPTIVPRRAWRTPPRRHWKGAAGQEAAVLGFCAQHGITVDVDGIPIHEVNDAFDRTQQGDVRFCFVIDMATLADDTGEG